MDTIEKDDNTNPSKAASTKKKSAPKVPDIETEKSTKTTEKKRKAPKVPAIADVNEYEHIDEQNGDKSLEKNNDTQAASNPDQEVPIKPKKKKAPKAEIAGDNNVSISADQPVKKKKIKAPKVPAIDDDFQVVENPLMDTLEPIAEPKLKVKKSKKSKLTAPANLESFDDVQITNLDEVYPQPSDGTVYNSEDAPIIDGELPPSNDSNASEYERALLDSYGKLASQVNFAQYVGDDQWCIIHLPKSARNEPKSRIRKILPGGNTKDDKLPPKKPTGPKPSLFNRIRASVTTLVRDENNMLFGEQSPYELGDFDEEPDGVDTDNLHRYAQQLRELEDKDREVNPEFLVLRDGKTVYGVHESDTDGKVKLSTRKPIYDRYADQALDEQSEKKKLLSRLKLPFGRNKDNGKDNKSPKSANTTPNPRITRKSSRKSLNDDVSVPPQ